MKWAIVALVVLVLALAGSTAYLGYDRIASDEDGEREQQPASEVAGVTPTTGPLVDLELSRRCYEAWKDFESLSTALSFAIRDAPEGGDPKELKEWFDTVLGPGWQQRMDSAAEVWQGTCLSPNVVPVPNPVNDIDVLCVAARVEALRLSKKPADEISGPDAARLTVLETFARLRCP